MQHDFQYYVPWNYWLILLTVLLLLVILPVASLAYGAPIIVARGDNINITTGSTQASIWIFGDDSSSHIYDQLSEPVLKIGYDDTNKTILPYTEYIYSINSSESNKLQIGKYTIVFQRTGLNTIKEVSYTTKPDSLGNPHDYIVSPYKGVPDVELGARQQYMIRDLFLNMIKTSSDDEIDQQQLNVEAPMIAITDVMQVNDTAVYVAGWTNMQSGTKVQIIWDEDKTRDEGTWKENTFYTFATSADPSQPRTFSGTFVVKIQDLSPGKHWVTAYANEFVSRVQITQHETFESNITMQAVKYFDGGVIVTPTPITVIQTVVQRVEVPVTVIQYIPTQSFPVNALGEEYDPTKVPDISSIVFPIGLLCVGVLVLGARKW